MLGSTDLKMATWMIIALAGTFSISTFGAAQPSEMDFEPFKWKKRLLLVFAPQSSDPLFAALQREISTRMNEVEDRDLVIFEILELGASRMNGAELDPHTAASLRKRFDVSPKAFALILVGKDSGIKLKRDDFNGLEEIFRLIDSMPMRRNEMRHKGQGS
jgi:hypothetical protein